MDSLQTRGSPRVRSTAGQRRSTTVNGGGPPVNHRRTTVAPPPDHQSPPLVNHRSMVVENRSNRVNVRVGPGLGSSQVSTWYHLSRPRGTQVEFFEGWKPLPPLQLAVEEVMSE
ncbi:hypothetical protein Tco_0405132 [Tanacetum coccineum]